MSRARSRRYLLLRLIVETLCLCFQFLEPALRIDIHGIFGYFTLGIIPSKPEIPGEKPSLMGWLEYFCFLEPYLQY